MNTGATDPLAHASAVPNVSALIEEFEQAQQSTVNAMDNIGAAEDVRYNRWAGKSDPPDGARWQKNATRGTVVRPYDGRPDCDVQLADEICAAEVDILMTALTQAQIGATTASVTPLTAAQVAELRAVGQWVRRVTNQDVQDDAELLAQMMTTLGWSVLNPGWLERWELVERELTLPELLMQLAKAVNRKAAENLGMRILDPTLEDSAVEAVQYFFAHLPRHTARRVVRELRTGPTKFLDRQLAEKRPTIRALIQGYNYFVSGGGTSLRRARGHLVVERLFQAELESVAADNDWNEEFVAEVLKTAGQFSAYGDTQREKQEDMEDDSHERSIELWTTSVLQFDPETGAAGIYCTTFSPHLKPEASDDGNARAMRKYYAKHYLLEYAHGRPPFVMARREVVGPTMNDSRGVPEMVRSDQKVIKNLQDAAVARAHLEVDPPMALTGAGWSKTTEQLGPGGRLDSLMPGADVKALVPARGDAKSAELAIQRVELGTYRRFALPNLRDGTHPSAWQMRQMRNVRRWLAAWEEAYWQLAVLSYQEMDPYELATIIGRWPQLSVEDLLRHRITLTFDARSLDNDWTQTVLEFVIKLLGIDSAGLMDRGPIIQMALAYIDPAMVDQIMRNPAGASAALYRQVENDVASIMDLNPPQLRENDASSGMQLQMAFAVIGKNPKYQELLRSSPEIRENLKTYMENLQHNVQETQISPVQGRLGVQAMPQRPVQQGNALEAEGEA